MTGEQRLERARAQELDGAAGRIASELRDTPARLDDLSTLRMEHALVEAWRRGDPESARAIHYRLLPLFDALFCETNPIPLKAAAELLGLCSGEIRLPLTPLTDANRERLQVALKELGLV